MNQIIESSAFDEEHIRKIWHKGEWYFSIVDIIASASERDQAAAT